MIYLGLFKANNFRWANMAMIAFAIGFNAMSVGNVLFLTRVWRYSILKAGLAISVGPLIVATTAPLFGKLAGRIRQRRLLVPVVGQALRNLGSTFGVALVIAFATVLTAADALDGFHHVWWLLATCGLTVSLLSTRPVRITAPVAPEMAALDAH